MKKEIRYCQNKKDDQSMSDEKKKNLQQVGQKKMRQCWVRKEVMGLVLVQTKCRLLLAWNEKDWSFLSLKIQDESMVRRKRQDVSVWSVLKNKMSSQQFRKNICIKQNISRIVNFTTTQTQHKYTLKAKSNNKK